MAQCLWEIFLFGFLEVFFLGGGYFSGFFFGFGFGFFVVDVLMFCFERDVSVLTICQKKNLYFSTFTSHRVCHHGQEVRLLD